MSVIMWKRTTRRIVLVLVSLVFLGIAIASLVAPYEMAKPLGYSLSNTNALSEFRAIYVGLWLAHGLIFILAAWRIDQVLIGDVCGILVLGQVVGRLISLVIDGVPTSALLPVAIAEFIGGVAIISLRPETQPPHCRNS